MADPTAKPVTAFDGVVRPGRTGVQTGEPGVTVFEIRGAGLAGITARKGQRTQLIEAVRAKFAVDLPLMPRRVEAQGIAFIWAGPDQWLVHAMPASAAGMEALLVPSLGGLAAIVDQSHGRTLLRLEGRRVRDTLAKGLGLDLHPRAFAIDDAAMTTIAHIGVHLWQTGDGALGPTYEIAIPRSASLSFWHWLEASSGEYGLEVRAGSA